MDFKEEQPLNADSPIISTNVGIVMDSNLLQLLKVPVGIIVIDGIVMDSKEEQSLNA